MLTFDCYISPKSSHVPSTVVARSEMSTLLWHYNTGIAGSEPAQSIAGWMDICIRLVGFFLGGASGVGSGFAVGRCPVLVVPVCTKLIQKSSEWHFLRCHWSNVKDMVRATMKIVNKMQLYRLLYYSKLALHVSGDVFAHHREHLAVFTVSDSIHPSCCRLVSHSRTSQQQLGWTLLGTVNTVKCSRWWAKTSSETCRANLE